MSITLTKKTFSVLTNSGKMLERSLDMKIDGCDNFYFWEFVKSDTATRLNIQNVPSSEHWGNIIALTQNVLQPLRNKFGRIQITSGYRSPKLCLALGSSTSSNHIRGQAADIEPRIPGVTLMNLLEYIHDNLNYRELIAEYFPDGWIHVAYRRNENTKTLKLKDKNNNYTQLTMDDFKNLYPTLR